MFTAVRGRRCGDGQDTKLKALTAIMQGPPTPAAPVKAPAASTPRRWKKIVSGQHDAALFHVLELQATAYVTEYPDINPDVRVLPFLSRTQSSLSCRRVLTFLHEARQGGW